MLHPIPRLMIINPYRFASAGTGIPEPLHYYDLNDLSGGITDQGTGNWGALSSVVGAPSVSSGTAPDGSGDCLDFTPTDDLTELAKPWDGAQDNMTISAWVNADSISSTRNLIVNWQSGTPDYIAGLQIRNATTDHWIYTLYETPTFYNALDTAESWGTTGNWYHIVATYDGTDMKIYKGTTSSAPSNDLVVTFNSPSRVFPSGNADFSLGRNSTSTATTQAHDGKLFAVGIWDVALTTTQMDELWNNGDGRTFSQL